MHMLYELPPIWVKSYWSQFYLCILPDQKSEEMEKNPQKVTCEDSHLS